MSLAKKNNARVWRRVMRVRSRLGRAGARYRISVFKSLKHIYAQVIDDTDGRTLASCSTLQLRELPGDKKNRAYLVGKELAARAKASSVERVVFDRGGFLYHGRIAKVAEGLRDGGLKV